MMKQNYETMIVRGKADDIGHWTENHDIAIEDMTGYIERMGGKLHQTLVEGVWVFYEFIVPAHWVGRLYERFLSFGFRAKVQPNSLWFGVLDETELEEPHLSQRNNWKLPDVFHFTPNLLGADGTMRDSNL